MKLGIAIAVLLGCELLCAQAPLAQNKPPDAQKPPSNSQKPATQSNPFPEDTTEVPVMPNGNAPAIPDTPSYARIPSTLPTGDVDPVRSPDDPPLDSSSTSAEGFSSST